MNTMPVAYLDVVHLEFANGRVWEINIKEQIISSDLDAIATRLLDTLQEYKDEIVKIDFKVDVNRLKKDIGNSTKSIF
jgi:beta-mannanase